jgi:hypothetical protein
LHFRRLRSLLAGLEVAIHNFNAQAQVRSKATKTSGKASKHQLSCHSCKEKLEIGEQSRKRIKQRERLRKKEIYEEGNS